MIEREYRAWCVAGQHGSYVRLRTAEPQRFARCPICGADVLLTVLPIIGRLKTGTDMSDDLVTWLRVQLDEDERVAREADGLGWGYAGAFERDHDGNDIYPQWGLMSADDGPTLLLGDLTIEKLRHIARHDPVRVLAEVAAKRRILDEHNLGYIGSRECRCCSDKRGDDVEPYPCPTVRLLALPYADRPGYREEWRP